MTAALFPDVVVNGETIPHKLIAAEAQNHFAPKDKPGLAWRKAAHAVAIRALLLQDARRRGISAQPRALGPGRYESEEEALMRGLLEEVIDATPPGDAAIRAEWERDPTRFRAPPLWEVSHILIACDPRDATEKQAAYAKITDVLKQVQARPDDFASFTARHSDCGSKSAGGALGQLGPGDTVPEFEAALQTLDEGQITPEPVLTRHGWHIIRMDAMALGAVLPFETVKPKIGMALQKAAWAQKSRAFVAGLVEKAHVTGIDLKPLPKDMR